MDSTKER